ncbi:hypothetical protein GCM10010387_11510 [Streptomyces inusitatus]|uniref:Protein kinase domain-containing protein n=1 Tax=Streptomyces inusitatus TaxID=68221 RepID=A0A918UMA5_9ACTN|nr:bifunctional serine/threonine-protein kinase/ABC transporter substrate-binding protein [Streptomyces inusitatus]GGZ20260.1 hypothetical protein GCM10010387_11510 [Streptomyces inusitatus]
MRPLKTADPSSIAGFRLIGRLGAGGMGVVYLARSARGTLCAVKVIRAEHAADPGFRARFRREAGIARLITGPGAVRVVDADPEAEEPWLATEFVPGPSLAEAVAAHGPLPEHTVRALGGGLAGTLAGAHEQGLIHRDVKPGNVLLALDGPRLIDFGIARSAGVTALTATDAMIGTPGYLSPEQARLAGSAEVGPAADVFSLGCVLAYALTGRRPFGTGMAAAIVFRTVHEEPDLDGVPPGLLPLLRSALAKDPAARPTARELGAALADPRTGAAGGPGTDWLPPGLPALIAERSARVLDLPVPEPTVAVGGPATPGVRGSRRRFLLLGTAAGAGGAAALWFGSRPSGPGTGAEAGAAPPRRVIGVLADLSGPDKAGGRTRERAARLAAETFNAAPDRPFELALRVRDDGGDPGRARTAAEALAADPAVLAVVDLTARKVTRATALRHRAARLPLVAVAADSALALNPAERRAYFELRPGHRFLLGSLTRYFAVRGVRRVAVVADRASPDFSWPVAMLATEVPFGADEVVVHSVSASARTEDFTALARAVLTGRFDGVIYAGDSPSRAARLARALADRRYTGVRGALEPVLEPEFLARAGASAEGWVFGTAYTGPAARSAAGSRAGAFLAAYRKRWKSSEPEPGPGRYAAEAYDAVLWLARAVREPGGGGGSGRAALLERLRGVRHEGAAKTIVFRDTTELLDESAGALFVHRVEGGRARFLGERGTVTAKS